MTKLTLPAEGGCRCGQVRIRVSKAPVLTMACHCKGCQRMTASAYSLSAAVPTDGFEVLSGEPVVGGTHSEAQQHMFCPHCMSWVFTKMAGMGWFVNVRAPLLDDASWYAPFVETQTAEKLPWATTPARHSYDRFPPMEAFEGLMKEYAETLGG